jgi:hypothetical protein
MERVQSSRSAMRIAKPSGVAPQDHILVGEEVARVMNGLFATRLHTA